MPRKPNSPIKTGDKLRSICCLNPVVCSHKKCTPQSVWKCSLIIHWGRRRTKPIQLPSSFTVFILDTNKWKWFHQFDLLVSAYVHKSLMDIVNTYFQNQTFSVSEMHMGCHLEKGVVLWPGITTVSCLFPVTHKKTEMAQKKADPGAPDSWGPLLHHSSSTV